MALEPGRLERLRRARRGERERGQTARPRRSSTISRTCGIFNDRMELRFDPSGTCTIVAGTFSHGQAHATTFAQVVVGLAWRAVRKHPLRPGRHQPGVVRPRHLWLATRRWSAALEALRARRLVQQGQELRRALLEASPADIQFKDGRFAVVGTDKADGAGRGGEGRLRPAGCRRGLGRRPRRRAALRAEPPNFPNGCHIARSRSIPTPAP